MVWSLSSDHIVFIYTEKGFAGHFQAKPFSVWLALKSIAWCRTMQCRIKIHFKPNNVFSPRSTPLNPMKAKDSNPAATSTIGMPLMPLGILT